VSATSTGWCYPGEDDHWTPEQIQQDTREQSLELLATATDRVLARLIGLAVFQDRDVIGVLRDWCITIGDVQTLLLDRRAR